jgi:hypothetical protein
VIVAAICASDFAARAATLAGSEAALFASALPSGESLARIVNFKASLSATEVA